MNKKTKLIFSATLLIGLIGLVLAFWAAGVFVDSDEDTILINVGSANEVFTTITINGDDASNLVPIGTKGNSPSGSVEYALIPIQLLWSENGTNWTEGIEGDFVITPTVELRHNVLVADDNLLEAAINLINVCFIVADGIGVEQINTALKAVEGQNLAQYKQALVPFNPSFDRFSVTLTIDVLKTIYLLVFVDMPNINTFEYIYESVIVVNAAINLAKEQDAIIPIEEVIGFKMTASGSYHTIALDDYGRLWSWGRNNAGQLGDNTDLENPVPKLIPLTAQMNGVVFSYIASSSDFNVAIDSLGRLWSWGANAMGQLGNGVYGGYDGGNEDVLVPTLIPETQELAGVKFISVSSATIHTVALDSNGQLWSWGGRNHYGELGNPKIVAIGTGGDSLPHDDALRPKQIPKTDQMQGVTFVMVGAGNYQSGAIDSDGRLWSWGLNGSFGLTGHGASDTSDNGLPEPTIIPPNAAMTGVVFEYISYGINGIKAIDNTGRLWAWGYGLLVGNTQTSSPANVYEPTLITIEAVKGVRFVQVCADSTHVLALDSLGRLWSWGNNNNGKTGMGTATGYTYGPTLIASVSEVRFKYITCMQHNMAIDLKGNIWSWGVNTNGQLGDGTKTGPVLVPTFAISASIVNLD